MKKLYALFLSVLAIFVVVALLLMFVLPTVTMNWGRGFVQDRTADVEKTTKIETSCALDVGFEVSERKGTPQLCYGGSGATGYVEFTLENTGKKDIEKVAVVIEGSIGIYQNNSLSGTAMIAGVGDTKQNISYSYAQYGSIEYIRFTPIIDIAGVGTPCSGSSIQLDVSELKNCST